MIRALLYVLPPLAALGFLAWVSLTFDAYPGMATCLALCIGAGVIIIGAIVIEFWDD